MKTFNRICIKSYEETDVLGHKLVLKKGEAYLTSEEKDGMVTVFTQYWHEVPVTLFAGEEQFT